jgi:mono/diheme cytochrome c family protein
VNRVTIGIAAAAALVIGVAGTGPVVAEDAAPAAPAAEGKMTPIDRVAAAPKGTLKNPYTDNPQAIEEGHKIYMGASCNGCHGGGGGGGMCPPLTNETWVYGGDDDTLFRLITLGSDAFKKTYNLSRKGQESVVGPMPPFGSIVTDEDKLWKVIAWVHSVWTGRPEKKTW